LRVSGVVTFVDTRNKQPNLSVKKLIEKTMRLLLHLVVAAILVTSGTLINTVGLHAFMGFATTQSNGCSRQAPDGSVPSAACVRFDFRFIELDQYTYNTSVLKHVEVFMDERDFKEDNLKQMLDYLSSKHSTFPRLVVVVHTNWNQLDTFASADCPGSGISEQPDRPDKHDYFQAVMYRYKQNQFFYYYPKLKSEERKTVVSKGKACWGDCD
jgi:hypothetical protein